MANKRIIELNERTTINMGDFLMVDDATGSRKLAMSTLFNYLTYSSLMFVDTLPTTDIDPTVIYLVPHSGSTTQWDEYIYRDNQWILIGTSTLDLTSIYQTKTDNSLQTTSKQVVGAINEIKSALSDLKSSISVTADGVKTWSTIFNSLYSLVDSTKVNAKSMLEIGSNVLPISGIGTFYAFSGVTNDDISRYVTIKSSGSQYRVTNITTDTISNWDTNVPNSGTQITLYY